MLRDNIFFHSFVLCIIAICYLYSGLDIRINDFDDISFKTCFWFVVPLAISFVSNLCSNFLILVARSRQGIISIWDRHYFCFIFYDSIFLETG